jgi:hypothetical protein
MSTTTKTPPLSVAQAQQLADDLIRQLAPDAGNQDALAETFMRWVNVLDHDRDFSKVCIVALGAVFADCLIPTPVGDLPAGAHVFQLQGGVHA